ncbi:MAG: AraC family transcriptional regulator [Deltaproteobacteria bacterium]|nr:AraC family transcriptional regulator [Kofleriaceae bacterium]
MARRTAEPRMRSQLVAPLLGFVRERGGDPAALIARFDLSAEAIAQPEVVLPLRTLHALLDQAAAQVCDPFLGLHLAARFPRGTYGVLEYAGRSAPTVREALVRIVRYIGLLNELVTVSFEPLAHGGATIEQRIAGEPRCVGRHGNEFFVAMLLLNARALTTSTWMPSRAWFAHPMPEDVSELVALLGTRDLRWDAGANGMELAAEVLDAPLTTADPPLLSLLERQAEQALPPPGNQRLVALIKRRVRDTLVEAPPTLESVAAELRMSPRTLQRQLAEEGTGFADLLDELRRELALEYVRDPGRPLGEIAYLLGYSELSAFLRAFKRWTGKTPSDLRGA